MKIGLINTNRLQPPVAPIGLDYVAEVLHDTGHEIALLDLCWEEDAECAIIKFLNNTEYGMIGMTLRNTDDCAFTSRQSFIGDFAALAKIVRAHTHAPIVVGGVGFSVMPEHILALSPVDYGIWGEGEFVLPRLAAGLAKKQSVEDLPNLVWCDKGIWRRNPPSFGQLADLPPMRRQWLDNRRYFQQGGQAGFETKRGCPAQCTFCADPIAKGRPLRLRPPKAVVEELTYLLAQGIDVFHTCDGEFNLSMSHALELCREIVRQGLGNKIRWYAYCSPMPYSQELAQAMRAAGCAGIDFGADHGNPSMLKRLGRDFGPDDICHATRWSKEAGMAVMLDLLLGAPGETKEGIEQTIAVVRQAGPDLAGVSLGVRLFPGTELTAQFGEEDEKEPAFFLEPQIAPFVFEWMNALVGNDPRFLFFDPSRPKQNYNYNSNQRLVEAIREGYRGAFWDILRIYPGK
jgi:tryptophan 2-C-methyltransferase